MPFDFSVSVPAFTVFLQGILSFFSPCVLPLVPLYVSYLAGGTRTVDEEGTVRYKRRTIFLNTLFFVLGISFTFFLLGLGFTAVGRFFSGNQRLFAIIGGVIVILFGLLQLGVFQFKALGREQRLPFNLNKLAMNPLTALLLGFTFSFAWTPCVGPALASVLLMASSASSAAAGFLLIGVYTLGFVIPFLAVGLFTGAVLDFFRRHRKVVAYTAKIGGVLMILMGIMMITGWMNSLTGYLSNFGGHRAAAPPLPRPCRNPPPLRLLPRQKTRRQTRKPAPLPPRQRKKIAKRFPRRTAFSTINTAMPTICRNMTARWCSSTSGRRGAATASRKCRTSKPSTRNTA